MHRQLLYRVFQLNVTLEIEVFHTMFDRFLPIFSMTYVKQLVEYFYFRCYKPSWTPCIHNKQQSLKESGLVESGIITTLLEVLLCVRAGERNCDCIMPIARVFQRRQKKIVYGASIHDVCKISNFLPPCHCHKSADFVPFVCFLGTPSPAHCGRYIWKPPYGDVERCVGTLSEAVGIIL